MRNGRTALIALSCTVTHTAAEPAPALVADVSVWSAYVSRGQFNSDWPVAQASLQAGLGPFHAEIWSNVDLESEGPAGRHQFSEINLLLGADYAIGDLALGIGYGELMFPGHDAPLNREVSLSANWERWRLRPFAEAAYEFADSDGLYLQAGAEWEAYAGKNITLVIETAAGWGSRGYNRAFFEISRSEWNDYRGAVRADWSLGGGRGIGLRLGYSGLWNRSLRDAANALYARSEGLYGGLSFSSAF